MQRLAQFIHQDVESVREMSSFPSILTQQVEMRLFPWDFVKINLIKIECFPQNMWRITHA
ncbi:hypothetical protein BV511_23525 [Methylorubrum extorquens]|nr:hypothetical protein BV511_23525 [Methylorubrum extorquens]